MPRLTEITLKMLHSLLRWACADSQNAVFDNDVIYSALLLLIGNSRW